MPSLSHTHKLAGSRADSHTFKQTSLPEGMFLVSARTNYIAVQPAGDPGLKQGVLTHVHT